MNRQDFEREATLRMLPACSGNFADPAGAADFITETVKILADRLYADTTPRLFGDAPEASEMSNGDRSGITFDELRARGEVDCKTRNVMIAPVRVEYLAELAGQRRATLMSYRGVGRKMVTQIEALLKKYGYEALK